MFWEITSGSAPLADATNLAWEVNLEGDITIVAHFGIPVPPEDVSFNVDPAGAGSIILDGVLITDYPSTQTLTVSGHTIQAVSSGQWWQFSHWSSTPVVNVVSPDMNASNANLEIALPGVVTAHFTYIEHTELEVEIKPSQAGAVSIYNTAYVDDYWTSGLVTNGPLIFKAIEADQWEFDRWIVQETEPSPNDRNPEMALNLEGVPFESVVALFKEVEFSLFIPNAFTPDNDGVNDSFLPLGQGFTADQYRFTVLNRWGEVVFDTTNPDLPWVGQNINEGGTHFVPDGVYMYTVTALGSHDLSSSTFRGCVTVVR